MAAAIEKLGMSKTLLAQRLGISSVTLFKLLTGRQRSSGDLRKIYLTLHLPVDLMGKQDPDETRLLTAYRQLKASSPAAAEKAIVTLETWADGSGKLRQLKREVEEAEERLLAFPADADH